jgi:hypothetical protein
MSTFLSLIAFILFVAFIIGLIKPSLVKMPGRKQSVPFIWAVFWASA